MNKLIYGLPVMGIILGVFIAILFGINEGIFKGYIADNLEKNSALVQNIAPEKQEAFIKKEKDKNWRYFQRYHFHSTATSTMAMVLLFLLAAIDTQNKKLKEVTGLMISIGSFLYPFVWLFAGIWGPLIGRTAAKEQFSIFAYMGSVFLVGTIILFILLIKDGLKEKSLNI